MKILTGKLMWSKRYKWNKIILTLILTTSMLAGNVVYAREDQVDDPPVVVKQNEGFSNQITLKEDISISSTSMLMLGNSSNTSNQPTLMMMNEVENNIPVVTPPTILTGLEDPSDDPNKPNTPNNPNNLNDPSNLNNPNKLIASNNPSFSTDTSSQSQTTAEHTEETNNPTQDTKLNQDSNITQDTKLNQDNNITQDSKLTQDSNHTPYKDLVHFTSHTHKHQTAVQHMLDDHHRAERIAKQQLGIEVSLKYLSTQSLSLEAGMEFPEEGIEVNLPVDVANGTQIIILHYIESENQWEALTAIANNRKVEVRFFSFSPIILYELIDGVEPPVVKEDGITYFTVGFKDIFGKVVYTREVPEGSTVDPYTNHVNQLIGLTGDRFFEYWSLMPHGSPFDFENTIIERSVNFVPVLSQGHYVIFLSEGTQVDPQLVRMGEVAFEPEPPTRAGYTFVHWSLDSDISESKAYDFNMPIRKHVSLRAVWKPETVSYRVVFWVEKPDIIGDPGEDTSNYEFYKEVLMKATAGSLVDYRTESTLKQLPTADQKVVDPSFKIPYATFARGEQKEVNGAGTTIVNVFFNRILFTIHFDLNPGMNSNTEANNARMWFDGQTKEYKQGYEIPNTSSTGIPTKNIDTERYSFQAKYEQDIEQLWPSSWNATFVRESKKKGATEPWNLSANKTAITSLVHWSWDRNTNASRDFVTKRIFFSSEMLPMTGTTTHYVAEWGNVKPGIVNYYMEQLPGQVGEVLQSFDKVTPDRWYVKDERLSQKINAETTVTGKQIDGYEFVGRIVKNDINEFNLYYIRTKHTLSFNTMGGTPTIPDKSVMFGMNLSHSSVFPAVQPTKYVDGVESTFAGWYLDAGYKFPLKAGDRSEASTMPNHDLTLYAKWIDQPHNVTYYPNLSKQSQPYHAEVVAHGEYAKSIPLDIDGQAIANWYIYIRINGAEVPIAYHPESIPINKDLHLYAGFSSHGHRVTYHVDDLVNGSPPQDENSYAHNTQAIVLSKGKMTRKGHIFVGWKSNVDERIYVEGDGITMLSNVTLTALWEADDSQMRDLMYTVRYTLDGVEVTKDTYEVHLPVWSDAEQSKGVKPIPISAENNRYYGYHLLQNPYVLPPLIYHGEVITVPYVINVYQISVLDLDGVVVKHVADGFRVKHGHSVGVPSIPGYRILDSEAAKFAHVTEDRIVYAIPDCNSSSQTFCPNDPNQGGSGGCGEWPWNCPYQHTDDCPGKGGTEGPGSSGDGGSETTGTGTTGIGNTTSSTKKTGNTTSAIIRGNKNPSSTKANTKSSGESTTLEITLDQDGYSEEPYHPQRYVPSKRIIPEDIVSNEDDWKLELNYHSYEQGSWALINFLLMILTALTCVMLLVLYIRNRREETSKQRLSYYDELSSRAQESYEEELRFKRMIHVLSIVPAVVAIVVFYLTEDIRLPMTYTDQWTVLMILIAMMQMGIVILSKRRVEGKERERVY